MSDTLADVFPDLSPARKRSGMPTVHQDGTCSWRWAGCWYRTPLAEVDRRVVFWLPAGRLRAQLAVALDG